MDRALKERVVGATVLVVIAVLVVPVFLDGPFEEPERVTETVTLPGRGEQSTKRQTIVLERDRAQPVPTGSAPERDDQAGSAAPPPGDKPATPAKTTAKSAEPKPAGARSPGQTPPSPVADKKSSDSGDPGPAAPATDSATGMWAVQLGSFSNQTNAQRLAADLRKQGYAAFLSRVRTNSDMLHRVRVGPQQNRASAEKVAAQLGSDGHKGQVVPHP